MAIKTLFSSIMTMAMSRIAKARTWKYAVEVDADSVDEFEIPGTQICDQWENGDGSAVFVIQATKSLKGLSGTVKGIRGVTRL